MRPFRRLLRRLRYLVDPDAARRDVQEELQFHIEQQTAANVRAGMTPEDARRAAIESFGRVGVIQDEVHDVRAWSWLESLVEDVRFGARILRRNPAFAVAVVGTIAVTVAACATMFSLVDAVLLRPIAFPEPDRLVSIFEASPDVNRGAFSPPNFFDVRDQGRSLAAVATYHRQSFNLVGRETTTVPALNTSPELFRVLGIQPLHGRVFGADAAENTAVVSWSLATREYGSAAAAVNRPLILDGQRYTVAGVMPRAFHFPTPETEIWVPIRWEKDVMTQRGAHYLRVIGRLRAGASPEAASRELEVIASRLRSAYPDTNEETSMRLERYDEVLISDVRRGLVLLFAAVVLLALIACANLANLLMVRAASREHESALRSVLGASGMRVLRQHLTEAAVCGVLGGALALPLAWAAVRLLVRFGPRTIPRIETVGVDLRVILFTAATAILASLFFGLLPALAATRSAHAEALKRSGARAGISPAAKRVRALMAAGQLALAVTLLAAATLMVRSFLRVTAVDPGFDSTNVVTFDLSLPSTIDSTERINAFHDDALARLRALPGVDEAGVISHLPIAGGDFSSSFRINGVENDAWVGRVYVADGAYFRALKIPLLRGRMFDDSERAGSPRVVLASESAAKKFWPNGNALGNQVRFGASGGNERYEGQIIGIVRDVRQQGLDEGVEPTFYVPLRQAGLAGVTVVMKTSSSPATLTRTIREQIAAVDRNVAAARLSAMDEHLADSVERRRFQASLMTFFAAAALLLALLGIYGVIAFSVAQRTREIGVRIALGASLATVFRMIVGEALRLSVPAIAIGVAGAIAARRVLAQLLFGVDPTDAPTLVAVAVCAIVIALLAACVPARRATRVPPAAALRYE